MALRTSKRGHGGGEYGDAVLLGAIGLGKFARLGLPDPPDGVQLDATYNHAAGRISVSVHGEDISASAADLAAALALPPGAVGVTAGVPADFFSSAEAIAAVRMFVRDRLLLGNGKDCGTASEDVAAVWRLVEEGKAYEVDWAALVWRMLKGEVVAGMPQRRYWPFLLRLLEYQRPELFAEVDEGLPLRKRGKGTTLQPCLWKDDNLGISKEHEVERKEISLAYAMSPDIGDLEEMPIFGDGREVTLPVPEDCEGTFLELQEIHEVGQGYADIRSRRCSPSDAKLLDFDIECDDGKGIGGSDARNETFAYESSFGWQLSTIDEQDESSSPQQLISGTKHQPASNMQQTIEIEDDDDEDLGVGIRTVFGSNPEPGCLVQTSTLTTGSDAWFRCFSQGTNQAAQSSVVRSFPLDISPYPLQQCDQTIRSLSFNDCLQQVWIRALSMQNGYLDKEKKCEQLQAEVQCLKRMVMEKEHIIEATKCDTLKNLRVRDTRMRQFEKSREVMFCCVQHYAKLVKKSSAEFREYKNMMLRGKGVDSYLGASDILNEQKLAMMQPLSNYCLWIHSKWSSGSLKLDEKVKQMAKEMANIDYELKRLKESLSIPDLNSGTGDDCDKHSYVSLRSELGQMKESAVLHMERLTLPQDSAVGTAKDHLPN